MNNSIKETRSNQLAVENINFSIPIIQSSIQSDQSSNQINQLSIQSDQSFVQINQDQMINK